MSEEKKPLLVVGTTEDYDKALASFYRETFSGMEGECPIIYVNTDEMYRCKIVTPDMVITLMGGRVKRGEYREGDVWVTSKLHPPDETKSRNSSRTPSWRRF